MHPPEPISGAHRLDGFDCGKPALDHWLRARALANEGKTSRTFVVPGDSADVLAYYTLATGSVALKAVPRKVRQNLPDPVPVMVLGRLAVDTRQAGQGIGSALLRDAMQRTLAVSRQAGVRALIVHAIDEEAAGFYTRYGFERLPGEVLTLFLPIESIGAALG